VKARSVFTVEEKKKQPYTTSLYISLLVFHNKVLCGSAAFPGIITSRYGPIWLLDMRN